MVWHMRLKLKEELQQNLVIKNLIYLFINLRDGNVNPKEVLTNKNKSKSNLGGIRKKTQNHNQKIKYV